MKTLLKIITLSILISISASSFAQNDKDSLGLPGDNLDLAAVLNIFKQSNSVEEFEKKLNAADVKVNNLDLNHDGQVDYIRVIESGKDNTRELVLQVPVSKSESQDIAVIQLEKKDGNLAHVQIVGDETLYGKDYIIEPQDETKGATKTATTQTTQPAAKKQNDEQVDDVYAAPGSTKNNSGNNTTVVNNNYYGSDQPVVYVNVWAWPCVPYMYGPGYSFWVSPWYWGYYPVWWSPWAPYGWYTYHQYMMGYGYYGYYRYAPRNHMAGAYNGYYGHRVSSSYVQKTSNPGGNINRPRYSGEKQMNNPQKYNQPVQQKNTKQAPVFKPQGNPNQGGWNRGGGMGGGNRGGGGMGGGQMGGGGGGGRRR